jgi:hypothetical protein
LDRLKLSIWSLLAVVAVQQAVALVAVAVGLVVI